MMMAQLKLQALNPSHNVARYYEIEVMQDLFGDWVIMTYYGRIRLKGQRKQYGYSSQEEMSKKLFEILHKRFHAQKRIGCNYNLSECYGNKTLNDLDALITHAQSNRRPKPKKSEKLTLKKPLSLEKQAQLFQLTKQLQMPCPGRSDPSKRKKGKRNTHPSSDWMRPPSKTKSSPGRKNYAIV